MNKKWLKIILIICIGGLIMGVSQAQQSLNKEGLLHSKGIDGMEIISLNVNGVEIEPTQLLVSNTKKEYSFSDKEFDFKSKIINENNKGVLKVKQDIFLVNKNKEKSKYSFSTLIQIDESTIRWNGTIYNLNHFTKSSPLILKPYLRDNELVIPNIFFGAYNKQIQFSDVGEKGGYAIAYTKGKESFLELIIPSVDVPYNQEYHLDPVYTNHTLGFALDSLNADPQGLSTNGTDFWVMDDDDAKIYHYLPNGSRGDVEGTNYSGSEIDYGGMSMNSSYDFILINIGDPASLDSGDVFYHLNLSGVVSTSYPTSFREAPINAGIGDGGGVTTNGTDYWVVDDFNDFVYHFDKDWNNLTDGFSIKSAGAIDSQGITTNGTDFWVVCGGPLTSEDFVYHFDKNGNNLTDGFSIKSAGISYAIDITSNLIFPRDKKTFILDFWIIDDVDRFVYHFRDTNPPGVTVQVVSNTTNPPSPTFNNLFNFYVEMNNTIYESVSAVVFGLKAPNGSYVFQIHPGHKVVLDSIGGEDYYLNYSKNFTLDDGGEWTILYTISNKWGTQINTYTYPITILDSSVPILNITSPFNNTLSISNPVKIEFTLYDDISKLTSMHCWYNNNSNPTNISLISCSNFTFLFPSEHNNLTLYANDSYGNVGISFVNFSLDAINPLININQPVGTKSSRIITTSFNVSDNTGVDYCYYNVTLSTGVSLFSPSNIEIVNCSQNTTFTFNTGQDGSDMVFRIFANDTTGNANSSYSTFTVDTSSSSPPGGGGSPTSSLLYAIIGESCDDDGDCVSGLCDLEEDSLYYQTCQSTLCGNGVCGLDIKGNKETYTSCPEDCGVLTQLTRGPGVFLQWLVIGFFIAGILFIASPTIGKGLLKKRKKDKSRR